MADAIARHYELLDAAITSHDGVRPLEQGEGDSVVAAFSRASDAVLAALDAQRALFAEPWPTASPLKVRMAVHTGEARLRDDRNYAGQAVIRTARLRAIAHGGQVVISSASRDLVIDHLGDDVTLVDLGVHRLKDLARPEHVWQLAHADLTAEFPPLRSLDAVPNNLPVTLSSFIGRFDDIVTVVGLLDDNRLITLTGSGGAGKTRLAQQVAAEVAERYPDGVWWVDLVGLTNPALVPSAISRATMVPEDPGDPLVGIAERMSTKSMLLVLDNCEHLLDGCADVAAALLASCSDVTVLATSRAPLNVPGELSWRVPPLAIPARGAAARAGRGALAVRRGSPLRRPCDQRPAELPPARRQRGHRGRDLRPARRDTTGHRAGGGALSRAHARADPRRARQHDRDARRRHHGWCCRATRRSKRRSRGVTRCSPRPSSCSCGVWPSSRVRSPSMPPRPSYLTSGCRWCRCSTCSSTSWISRSCRWTTPRPRRASACSRPCASSRDASSSVPRRSTRSRRVTRRTSPHAHAHCGRCSMKA